MEKMKNYLILIRVKHYIKNLLIFIPLIFSGLYKDTFNVFITVLGFILFSFVSSIVYVINDICDVEKDKLHDVKRNRPLPSGKVSIKEAYLIIIVLALICLILGFVIYINTSIGVACLPLLYVLINILYSKWLKNIVLVDVVILVIGFLIRLFFGSLLIDTFVSNYLYLTVMAGAFYLGFGKRRNEIMKNNDKSRSVLKYYNKDFLDKNMYVCLALTIVFYSMWATDPLVISKINNNMLIWTVPIIMLIFFEYSLVIESGSYGDPVEVVINNKGILWTILFYILVLGLIIFV